MRKNLKIEGKEGYPVLYLSLIAERTNQDFEIDLIPVTIVKIPRRIQVSKNIKSKLNRRETSHFQTLQNSSKHPYAWSTKCNLAVPKMSTTYGQKLFAFRGADTWNKLDSEMKLAPSIQSFKTKLKALNRRLR